MEGISADDGGAAAPLAKWRSDFSRAFQYYLDRSTPHPVQRWLGTVAVFAVYVLRVYFAQGFYIVSYGLGIYVLNLLIGFLSPIVDPELEVLDGASLPTRGSDEFKPFICRLPEFKFWGDCGVYAMKHIECLAHNHDLMEVTPENVFLSTEVVSFFVSSNIRHRDVVVVLLGHASAR